MPNRLAISDIIKQAGALVQQNAAQLARGAVLTYLEENREELLAALAQADHERGAAVFKAFCQRFPWAAGVITFAMNGSPEIAISTVGAYDPQLAEGLRLHQENFSKLQDYWRRGATQRKDRT